MIIVRTIIAIPNLPSRPLESKIRKFIIGSRSMVFQRPVGETTPETKRKSRTAIATKMSNLRTLIFFTGTVSAIVSLISLAQRHAPVLSTGCAIQREKLVVLSIYVDFIACCSEGSQHLGLNALELPFFLAGCQIKPVNLP